MKKTAFILLLFLQVSTTKANSIADSIIYPEVGKPCPDFILRDVEYYAKKKVTLKDFNGKWLMLDFWSSTCTACLHSFPHINQLQQAFQDKIHVLLVGKDDDRIRLIYSRFRQKENLDLPCAFDTALFSCFDIGAVPFVVVVDNMGVIRAITTFINADNLDDLLSGKTPPLVKAFRRHPSPSSFNEFAPFLENGNGGDDSDFVYRSVLSNCNANMPIIYLNANLSSCIRVFNNKRFQIMGTDLGTLYRYAYFGKDGYVFGDSLYGKVYRNPIFEIKDSSAFNYNEQTRKGLYCYSLSFPQSKSDPAIVMKMIQRDLQTYFDYKVIIETRKIPYWKLVLIEGAKGKLRTKSNVVYSKGLPHLGFLWRDISVKDLLNNISVDHQNQIFIDETGIDYNIDIDLSDCFFPDLNDVKKALFRNGLNLVKGEKEMKVLVVRDNDL